MKGWGSQKRLFLGGQTGGSANRTKKSTLKILIHKLICVFLSYGYRLMSQDSWENFGVKTPISIGGWRGGGGGGGGGWGRRGGEGEKGYVESRIK